jgi:hypothetical protein
MRICSSVNYAKNCNFNLYSQRLCSTDWSILRQASVIIAYNKYSMLWLNIFYYYYFFFQNSPLIPKAVIYFAGLYFYRLQSRLFIFMLLTLLIFSVLIITKLHFKNLISLFRHLPFLTLRFKNLATSGVLWKVICVIKHFIFQNSFNCNT